MINCDHACVLIVDDDETIRNALSDVLEDEGHLVETAANGIARDEHSELTSELASIGARTGPGGSFRDPVPVCGDELAATICLIDFRSSIDQGCD